MLTNDMQSARLMSQFGKSLVYVEFVVTAPWNRSEVQQPPRYTGVGGVFIDTAIQLSLTPASAAESGCTRCPSRRVLQTGVRDERLGNRFCA